jgi:hypothetical protein
MLKDQRRLSCRIVRQLAGGRILAEDCGRVDESSDLDSLWDRRVVLGPGYAEDSALRGLPATHARSPKGHSSASRSR